MSVEHTLKEAQSAVPEQLFCGYVDMDTGMLLGVNSTDVHPSQILETVTAETAVLSQGPHVHSIEAMFRKLPGSPEGGEHYFQDILVFDENLIHVFLRKEQYPEHAVTFVCKESETGFLSKSWELRDFETTF